MRKKKTRSSRWVLYLAVCFITFFASACIGYFIVSSNSSSIGNFVKEAFSKGENSSVDSEIQVSSEFKSSAISNETSSEELSSDELSSLSSGDGDFLTSSLKVENAFFKKVLFIGDEQLIGLKGSGQLSSGQILADGNLTPLTAETKEIFPTEGENHVTLLDAFKYYNPDQIYITFSSAMLSDSTEDELIEGYKALIKEIQTTYPEVPIIVEMILPVTENYSRTYSARSNKKIESLNVALKETLASIEGVYLLDIPPDLMNSNGILKTEYTSDGYRLNGEGYTVWADYINTHTYSKGE